MNTKLIFILLILAYTNSSLTENKNVSKINKMLQTISSLNNSLSSTRSKINNRFLKLDEETNNDITPVVDAMNYVKKDVDKFNSEFNNFFETRYFENFENFIQKNKKDLEQVEAEKINKIANLNFSSMNDLMTAKFTLETAMENIISQSIDVQKSFQNIDNIDNDIGKSSIFTDTVKKLDKSMLSAMQEINNTSIALENFKVKVIQLEKEMAGFVGKLEEAKNSSSPYMKNSMEIFGDSLASCKWECGSAVIIPMLAGIPCLDCTTKEHLLKTNQQNQLSRILEEKKQQFGNFISYFNSSGEIAEQMGGRATKQKEELQHFKTTLQVMEAKIGTDIKILFIKTSKNRIYEAMTPLQEACEELMNKLK